MSVCKDQELFRVWESTELTTSDENSLTTGLDADMEMDGADTRAILCLGFLYPPIPSSLSPPNPNKTLSLWFVCGLLGFVRQIGLGFFVATCMQFGHTPKCTM